MISKNINTKELSNKVKTRIDKGLRYLERIKISDFKIGTFKIDDNEIFALHQEYMTISKDECKFEAHKKYIDIQYILKGEEFIGYIPTNELDCDGEYNTQNDIVFFKNTNNTGGVILKAGEYAIFEPNDAHAPKGIVIDSTSVKKIVIKVLAK